MTLSPRRSVRRFGTGEHEKPEDPFPGDARSQGERDRDRILYSSAFRRLSGVTQVASPTELHPVHNRMIHSLKVAQVGRGLAMQLLRNPANRPLLDEIGGIDPAVVEAAGLAHDLGHPPFGHVAEDELDHLVVKGGKRNGVADGYNGNAQSFRIVTKLAVRYSKQTGSDLAGLNLTRATLNAILKYPWLRGNSGRENKKWGAYYDESEDFDWARLDVAPVLRDKTIEAALMDWADDISYAVHDVEDFFRAGMIPLDRLVTDEREQQRFGDWAVQFAGELGVTPDEIFRSLMSHRALSPGVLAPFRGSRSDRASLRALTSQLIDLYVNNSLCLRRNIHDQVVLEIDPTLELQVEVLKLLTRFYVIESPSMVSQRYGQRKLIRSLFNTFLSAANSRKDRTIFPAYFQEAIQYAEDDNRKIKRIVADLIASMSEAQAIAIHQRLSGQSLGSAMDAYLQ
jgi:dGTPase